MKTIYILRLAQLTKSNPIESIKAFAEHTGLDPKVLQKVVHEEGGASLNLYNLEDPKDLHKITKGTIALFLQGKISETEFVRQMNLKIGSDLSLETFKKCWNAMCTITPETMEYLRKIEKLQKLHGFVIHVMSNTNVTQAEYIAKQFATAGLKLDMSHTFSFEIGRIDAAAPVRISPAWKYYNFIDLRDSTDILLEFNKLGTISPAVAATAGKSARLTAA